MPCIEVAPALKNVLLAYSFAMGAIVASFLNVVIWRVPRGESIVSPPSHCPKCGAAIRWYQNIPILSWLALRGKCAACRAPISPRYVLVETLGGVLFALAFLKFGLFAPVVWIWIALMIAGSFIDFDHKLLPDFVTVGGMVLGLVVNSVLAYVGSSWMPLWVALGGMSLGLGLLWLIRYFGTKAFRREAMGMGDVLLMGAVGALFGPVAVLFTLIASSLLGSVVGCVLLAVAKSGKRRFIEIPFGPYICLACLAWMFHGPALVSAYLKLLKL